MQQTQKGTNKEVSMANSEKLNKHIQNTAHEGSKQTSHIMRRDKSGSGHPHSLAAHEESQQMGTARLSLKRKAGFFRSTLADGIFFCPGSSSGSPWKSQSLQKVRANTGMWFSVLSPGEMFTPTTIR